MTKQRLLVLTAIVMGLTLLASGASSQEKILGKARLLAGPMLGAVEKDSARIWMRVSGPHEVLVELAEDRALKKGRRKLKLRADSAERCFLVAQVDGLEPGREYWYRVRVAGSSSYLNPPWSFRTAPAGMEPFTVAYGSCARWQESPKQPIWDAVERARPDLFFWLGDNFYGDSLDPEVLEYEGLRQRTVPDLQPILRSVPQLATWDDHDFGINNYDRRHPAKAGALEFFRRYWANPSYGTSDCPGVFFRYSYSGVDFFFVDGRYYRDPNKAPDGPEKTMLGAKQLAWLKRELKASTGVFKILVSGSGWSKAKGPGGDAWSSYLRERDALFDFIREEKIEGVVLISGDTHVGELNVIPRGEQGGYDLYDFVSSPLAQDCTDSWLRRSPEQRVREVWFGGPNFGLLSFEPQLEDPRLSFRLVDQRGVAVWKPLVLRASELRNGQSTWRAKTWPARLLPRGDGR